MLHLPFFGVAGPESGDVPGGDLSRTARFLEERERVIRQSSWPVPSAFGRPALLVVVFSVFLGSGSGRHRIEWAAGAQARGDEVILDRGGAEIEASELSDSSERSSRALAWKPSLSQSVKPLICPFTELPASVERERGLRLPLT